MAQRAHRSPDLVDRVLHPRHPSLGLHQDVEGGAASEGSPVGLDGNEDLAIPALAEGTSLLGQEADHPIRGPSHKEGTPHGVKLREEFVLHVPAHHRHCLGGLVLALREVPPGGEVEAHHPAVVGGGAVHLDVGQAVVTELHRRVAHRLRRHLLRFLEPARQPLVVVPLDVLPLERIQELVAAAE